MRRQKVTPFLMFNGGLQAAIDFYTSTFPDSEVRNVARDGAAVPDLNEAPVAAHLAGSEIAIRVVVGAGPGSATVWTCDLTHGYIDINADYRS